MSPNVPEAPRGKAQNKRPACALSAIFWRVGPSTRGATAPQRAQQVNFVVCRWQSLQTLSPLAFVLIQCFFANHSLNLGFSVPYPAAHNQYFVFQGSIEARGDY